MLVKRPELSRKDKSIQTKVTSLFGKCNEEKVQILVFKCREEKSKAVRKINTQVQYRYLRILLMYSNKVLALRYLPPLWLTSTFLNSSVMARTYFTHCTSADISWESGLNQTKTKVCTSLAICDTQCTDCSRINER